MNFIHQCWFLMLWSVITHSWAQLRSSQTLLISCQQSGMETCFTPRRPTLLIIYHVIPLMTPPVSTARGPRRYVWACVSLCVCVLVHVCTHVRTGHIWPGNMRTLLLVQHVNFHTHRRCLGAMLHPHPGLVSSPLPRHQSLSRGIAHVEVWAAGRDDGWESAEAYRREMTFWGGKWLLLCLHVYLCYLVEFVMKIVHQF